MSIKTMEASQTNLRALFILLLILSTNSSLAQDNYVATSNADIEVEIEDLDFMLLHLTKMELEIEAVAWREELSSKVKELSQLEIQIRQFDRKAELLDQASEEVEDIADAVKRGDTEDIAEAKEALALTGQQLDTAPEIIDRAISEANLELAEKVAAKGEQLEEDKVDLARKVAFLRLEQGRISARFYAVLTQLEQKGGDITELRLYADAVSGIKINVEDTSTAWLAIMAWVKSEDGGGLLLLSLLKFIVAIAFVIGLSKLAGRIADRITRHNAISKLLENFIKIASRRTVLVIGFIMTLPIIGINVGPVLALIGAAGLVVGLALQGTLSNFASGVLILIYRPYDINDVIEVGGVSGMVNSMTLLCTTIKTLDNQLITVPNNSVWNGTITNITGSEERRVDLVFGIAYSDDFSKAQKIMKKILDAHPMVLDQPESNVRVHELGDSSVNLICRPWVKTEDYWDVHWDVIEAVKREFDAEGISIPFPQRDVHLIATT